MPARQTQCVDTVVSIEVTLLSSPLLAALLSNAMRSASWIVDLGFDFNLLNIILQNKGARSSTL